MTIKQLFTEEIDQLSLDSLAKYVNDPTHKFISSSRLESLIQEFPYDGGTLYRGLNFSDKESYDKFIEDIKDNKITTTTLTSWTRSTDTARQFAVTRPTYYFNSSLAKAEQARQSSGDYMIGYRGVILKAEIQPNIALDVNKSGVAAEDEVILPAGTYAIGIFKEEVPYRYRFTDNKKINDYILSIDKDSLLNKENKQLLTFILNNKKPQDLSPEVRTHIFKLMYNRDNSTKLSYNSFDSFWEDDNSKRIRIDSGFNLILLHFNDFFDQKLKNILIKDCDIVLKKLMNLLNSKIKEKQLDVAVDKIDLPNGLYLILDNASPGISQKYINFIQQIVSVKYNEVNSTARSLNKIQDNKEREAAIDLFKRKIENIMNFAKHVSS